MKRPWLLPLNPLYRAGLAAKNHLYRTRRLTIRELACPVVSVGSISAGGAGKTPAVLALATLLGRNGYAVDVLSRGYGRTSTALAQVDPAGTFADFGDEPLELARAGLDVFVGAERYAAGRLAEQIYREIGTIGDESVALASVTGERPLVHLLDDGFQHRRLARTFDIVVLTLADLHDYVLPAGNLREPLAAIRRADALIVHEDEADEIYAVTSRISRAFTWTLQRQLVLPPGTPARPFAFTGIARPESFLDSLAQAGQTVTGHFAFADHHPYSPADCLRLVQLARASGATGFVTTAKDAVKLTPELLNVLAAIGPTATARLQSTFLHERDQVRRQLLRVLPPA